jgi:hypothetical protein
MVSGATRALVGIISLVLSVDEAPLALLVNSSLIIETGGELSTKL